MADLTYEVKIDFGSIGGKKKLTFMSWNGNAPRYDIRDWFDDDRCGKGVALDKDELKTLYSLLGDMFGSDKKETTETADENPWDAEEEKATDELEEKAVELTDLCDSADDSYPETISKAFDALDKLFKGFEVTKKYGKMPFADGERVQYRVIKGKTAFPKYDDVLKEFDLKAFVTDKGNLYIYTM